MLRMVHRLLLIVYKFLRDSFVKYRIISLVIFASIGLLLFIYLPTCCTTCKYSNIFEIFWCEEFESLTRNSLSLLILGLPTLFILWIFRTHDAQRQIDNNTFFECVRMLTSKEKIISNRAALEQLVELKQKNTSYKERVDSLTQGILLKNTPLFFARLSGINLCLADLTDAYLTNANLSGANLRGADLTGTNLCDTILTDAILYGTDLEKAKHYDTANFKGARYDEYTKFPPGFDPEKAGCIAGRAEDITP